MQILIRERRRFHCIECDALIESNSIFYKGLWYCCDKCYDRFTLKNVCKSIENDQNFAPV